MMTAQGGRSGAASCAAASGPKDMVTAPMPQAGARPTRPPNACAMSWCPKHTPCGGAL